MFKTYPGLSPATNYEVNLNKICRNEKFKNYITAAIGWCPADLTVSCSQTDEGLFEFYPEIKHYGYEHLGNNGTEYSDMGDYQSGPPISDGLHNIVINYFAANEPEIYEVMLNNKIIK